MKKLLFLTVLFFFASCENSVTLNNNDDFLQPDNNEQQDEAVDQTVNDEEAQDMGLDEEEDTAVDTDVVWDNCSENYECESDEMCVKNIGDCNGWGHCEIIPESCDDVNEPVCGCDDVTYSNICEARKLLRNVKHTSECE